MFRSVSFYPDGVSVKLDRVHDVDVIVVLSIYVGQNTSDIFGKCVAIRCPVPDVITLSSLSLVCRLWLMC